MSQIPVSGFGPRTYTPVPEASVSVQFHGEESDHVRSCTPQPVSESSSQRRSPVDPPSYREATTREEPSPQSPLLFTYLAGYSQTHPTLENQNMDLEGDAACKRACDTACCNATGCFRLVVLLCIAVGFGLLYWELVFSSGLGGGNYSTASAHYWQRKQIGLRSGFGGVILFFALPLYLLDVFKANGPFRGLFKFVSNAHLQAHLDSVARGRPTVTWQMKCFHQDNRTVTITLPDCTSRTEHHNEKVIAWSGEEAFQFRAWQDVSPSDQLSRSGSYQTVTFLKKYVLADEKTKSAYLAQKEAFINSNRRRDQEYSIEDTFDVEGFQPSMLARTSSCFSVTLSPCLYILFALSFLAYLWSFIIRLGARRVDYTHSKKLSL